MEELLAGPCPIAPLTGSGTVVSFAILTLVFVAYLTAINSLAPEKCCDTKKNGVRGNLDPELSNFAEKHQRSALILEMPVVARISTTLR